MTSPLRLTRLLAALVLALTAFVLAPVSHASADDGSTAAERVRGFQAAQVALAELNTPYAWGGGSLTGPTLGFCDGVNGYLPDGSCSADHTIGFDCSGLVRYAWYQASAGLVTLPHYSGAQSLQGRPITRWDDLLPGDLLFFAEPGGPIHHVGLYLGHGAMVHSEHTGTLVTVLHDVFHDPKWGPRLVAATRPEPTSALVFAPPVGVAPGE
ncbi:C40 family peptidase [Streptacidiphilus neutrinimicus]|uniref:C40 family peptidase n=1 Tax=Streptacidiphilus neutrinimicus TaxID=105420 RepID=UPI000694C20A|nr:C40 family peptidase [Streptacidiphilus neutrinimicus]